MTGLTLSLTSTTNTNAAFRAWGSAISTSLATLGFIKTTDTGQIDWTTVVAPTGPFVGAGYEIWRFNDDLQSTRPIFFKLEYGGGGGVSNPVTPQIWVVVGTGSDGAGTLTSVAGYGVTLATRVPLMSTDVALTTPVTGNCYLADVDGSALGMLLWPSTNQPWGGMMFAIERTRNIDGTVNGDGFYWLRSSSSSAGSVNWQQFVFSGGYIQQAAISYVLAPFGPTPSGINLTVGNTLYPLPMFTGCTPRLQAPSRLLVALSKSDLNGNTQFTMTQYGVAATWVAAGIGSNTNVGWGWWSTTQSSTTVNSFAMNIS